MADYIHNNVPGIEVPEWVRQRMHQEGPDAGVEMARNLISELEKFAAGVHIMPINHLEIIPKILE